MESMVDEPQKPVVSGMTSFVLHLLYVIVIPLRLYDVYMTEGLSLQFAHLAIDAVMLALVLAKLCERISFEAFMVLCTPATIGYVATYEWDVVSCITVIGTSVVFIIVLVVFLSCDKNDNVEDILLPVTAKEVSPDKNGGVKDIPLPVGAKVESV